LLQPFFLAVGFHKPHLNFKFPEKFLSLYPIDQIDLAPNPFVPIGLPTVAYAPFVSFRSRDDVKKLHLSFPIAHVPEDFQVCLCIFVTFAFNLINWLADNMHIDCLIDTR